MEERHKKTVYLIAVILFLLVLTFVGIYVGIPMVRLAEDPEQFRRWVDSYGIWGRVLFVGIVVFQVLVAFVPGEPIELAAGYLFGVIEGSILTMAGFLIGSTVLFLLVRRFGVRFVEVFFSRSQIREIGFLKNPKKTKALAFILMTIPGTPKDFLSYFAGLTQLTLGQWLAIVAIARLPSLISSTVSGAAAGEEQYVLSAAVLGVTALFSLAGIWYYRRIVKQERKKELDAENPAEPD